MDLKNLFIYFALFIIRISADNSIYPFVKIVSFDRLKDYSSNDSSEAFNCYSKVSEHYEENVRLFICELDATPKTINDKLKSVKTLKDHAEDAIERLKSIGKDVLRLQKKLNEIPEGPDIKKMISIIAGAQINMQANYIAYLISRKSLMVKEQSGVDEIKIIINRISGSLSSKVAKRFSEFEKCMEETNKKLN